MSRKFSFRKISPEELEKRIDLSVVSRGGHSTIDVTLEEEKIFQIWARWMDLTYKYTKQPPNWIKELFIWGPNKWPITMSEILPSSARNKSIIDCGVYQDLSTRVLKLRGYQDVYPAQVFLKFPPNVINGWRGKWEEKGLDFHWGNDKIVYHELTGFKHPNKNFIELYDAAEAIYPFPIIKECSHSSLVALRINPLSQMQNGKEISLIDSNQDVHRINIGQWYYNN